MTGVQTCALPIYGLPVAVGPDVLLGGSGHHQSVLRCTVYWRRPLHPDPGQVMLKRFETQSISLETAKLLRPDYIRLSRDMSNDIVHDHSKRNFVETIYEAAKLIDIAVLAENVRSDEDFALLASIGFMGASR